MGDNKKSFQSPEVWKFKTAKKFRKCEIFMLCIFIIGEVMRWENMPI